MFHMYIRQAPSLHAVSYLRNIALCNAYNEIVPGGTTARAFLRVSSGNFSYIRDNVLNYVSRNGFEFAAMRALGLRLARNAS